MNIMNLLAVVWNACLGGTDLADLLSVSSLCNCEVSLQSRDRIGTGGPVVDCSRLFDNDLPDGSVLIAVLSFAVKLSNMKGF